MLAACQDDGWDDVDEIAAFITHASSPQPDPVDRRKWTITLPSEEEENRRPPALVAGDAKTPPDGMIRCSPWTSEELAGRDPDYLQAILTVDLQSVPRSGSKRSALRNQILAEQGRSPPPRHAALGGARSGRGVVVPGWSRTFWKTGCQCSRLHRLLGRFKVAGPAQSTAAKWVLNAVWELWDPLNPWELGIEADVVDEEVLRMWVTSTSCPDVPARNAVRVDQ